MISTPLKILTAPEKINYETKVTQAALTYSLNELDKMQAVIKAALQISHFKKT